MSEILGYAADAVLLVWVAYLHWRLHRRPPAGRPIRLQGAGKMVPVRGPSVPVKAVAFLLLLPALATAQPPVDQRLIRSHATDCTSLTDGVANQVCVELDSERLYTCQPTAGGCDTVAEWVAITIDGADVTSGTVPDARVDGSAEADELVLAGDVDGAANANDLDEVAVEAELEAVLDLADLQGAVTDGQVPNDITIDLAAVAASVTCTTCVDLTAEVSGTLPVGNGGTGVTTLTDGGLLLGSGTGPITALGVAANGQIPIGDGTTDPVLATLTGTAGEVDVTNAAGSITLGIPTSPTLDGTNFTGIPSSAITTEARSMYWPAGSLSSDGTQCADPTEATINSGPKTWTILCTDNDASTVYGQAIMPDGWDGGTVTFELGYIQTAADTSALNSDIAAQCHGAGETVDSTWGTEIAIDDAAVTGSNAIDLTTSAAVTPAGTCASGDILFWRWQLDATGTTTAVATLHIVGVKMEYTSTVGD